MSWGVRTGIFQDGERVTLTDIKGRRHSVVLEAGKVKHTAKGGINHDEIIGQEEGLVVTSVGGMQYTVFRPLLSEFSITMPRGAAVIYPKDAAYIVMEADIFPGARVLEAGVGSGALSLYLLRAIGDTGKLYSYEKREDFYEIAQNNVQNFMGRKPHNWEVRLGDLAEICGPEPVDRVVLDMLAPWDCVPAIAEVLVPGGLFCSYVATTTQMARVMDTLRAFDGFTEPKAVELSLREWHAQGLAVRPSHGGAGHTGFLVFARKFAPGVSAPLRKRRPAPGAYGPDYHGPRPAWALLEDSQEK